MHRIVHACAQHAMKGFLKHETAKQQFHTPEKPFLAAVTMTGNLLGCVPGVMMHLLKPLHKTAQKFESH